MIAYCRQRQNTKASTKRGNKGLVCVRRYLLDDAVPEEPARKSGWQEEDGVWRFYLGDTGQCVRNAWYLDVDGRWYWFDGAGRMVRDTWYQYQGSWYYPVSYTHLDEKSWADAALAQSYLLGVLHCMWALWDRKAENAKQYHEEIVRRSHRIE